MSECIEAPDFVQAAMKTYAAWQAALERLEQARVELKLAEQTAVKATAAKSGAGNAREMVQAERAALDALAVARDVVDVTQRQAAAARQAHVDADAEMHRPTHNEGRKIRLAACQRADAARAELVEAEAEFRRGTALIQKARDGRCKATAGMDGAMFEKFHATVEELALWGH